MREKNLVNVAISTHNNSSVWPRNLPAADMANFESWVVSSPSQPILPKENSSWVLLYIKNCRDTLIGQFWQEIRWYFYCMVNQKMLRICEWKQAFPEINFNLATALNLNKCLCQA